MFDLIKTLLGSGDDEHNLLLQARAQLLTSLDESKTLLGEIVESIPEATFADDLEQRARSVDKASNKAEREIRKLLVEHLSFRSFDVPAGLVMMSVAKDMERLVDEVRNLSEVGLALVADLDVTYRQRLHALAQEVFESMDRTCQAFRDNNEALALDLVEHEKPYIARVHELGDAVQADEGLGVKRAVLLSRGIHVLHRLRAHLSNIASTIVFPVHRIDFAKRSYVRQARQELGLDEG
ncbi:MAG: hypothetical protein EA401_01495 [Planctomycetota bacterium]|nr:MAG: hypothetical protein EA401_01495 [Planctomycetota bacterium]